MKLRKLMMLCCAVVMLGSCKAPKSMAITELQGEWNVVSINNQAVNAEENSNDVFIGFNTADASIYGCAGCNNMMGSFDVKAPNGELVLDKVGSTRMMCPDMETEDALFKAMAQVKGYVQGENGQVVLVDENKQPVIVLAKRCGAMTAEELAGEWKIEKINGAIVPGDLDKTPAMLFDIKESRLSANGGCNVLNSNFTIEGQNITLSEPMSTMMACPDMETEQKLAKAMSEAVTFGKVSDSKAGLFNKDGMMVIELVK